MSKTFRILSIDGGGIRGVIPVMVLAEIEARTGKPIATMFDLIAGTSTGGVIALGLVKPGADGQPAYSAQEGIAFYEREGQRVFDRSIWQRIRTLDSLVDEKYPAAPLREALADYFGETRLREALTDVLLPAYETQGRFAWFFRSLRARERDDYDFPMTVAAYATSAAPTYFEPQPIGQNGDDAQYSLIDGGVFAGNPAMCAYVDARTLYDSGDDVLVVSLGTGQHTRTIRYQDAKDWGMVEWALPMLDVFQDGVSATVDYQMQTLLKPGTDGLPRYYRFQTDLTIASDDMDNASRENLDALKAQGRQLIDAETAMLDKLCDQIG